MISSKTYLNKKNYFIFSILILGCPVLIFLTSTQKYQLFASSLIYFSLILSMVISKNYNRYFLLTILFVLSFCVTIKVNYFLPCSLIFFYCLVIANKEKELNYFILFSIVSFFLISFPHFYKNFLFYGDPLTPLFENFKKIPDPVILEFSRLEKNFAFIPQDNFFTKFYKIFLTFDPGNFSRALGIGIFGILLINFRKISRNHKIILGFILITFTAYLFLFIGMGRYYLEIFFASSLLISILYENLRIKKIFTYLVTIQSVLVFLSIAYGSFFLSPSFVSAKKSSQIKIIAAEGYDLYSKVDLLLPEESKIFIENSRSYSLVPREFISNKYYKTAKSLKINLDIDEIIKVNNVTHILTKNRKFQSNCAKNEYKNKIITQRSSRNPFNSRAEVIFYIYEVDLGRC